MPDLPLPPTMPESFDEFREHTSQEPAAWFNYFQASYTAMSLLHNEIQKLTNDVTDLRADLRAQHALYGAQLADAHTKLLDARTKEARESLGLNPPPVDLNPPPAPSVSGSASTRLSEKIPDPDPFSGDRKDLRRFSNQITMKLSVNLDRYPTPAARLTYVSSRLRSSAYDLVTPHITDGIFDLADYGDILTLLKNAYGDPDTTRTARRELHKLRQRNSDFSTFFAEFQRLAIDARMSTEVLPTIMEDAISRELYERLMNNGPVPTEYHELTALLQELDNRRLRVEHRNNTFSRPRPAWPSAAQATPATM